MSAWLRCSAAVCVVALGGVGPAAEPEKTGAALVAERIWWGAEFELTLTAPDTGEKFQRTRAGVVWDHLAFSNCFATDGKGALVAVVRFPKTKDEYTLRSVGPAEDLYAVSILSAEKSFPKLVKNTAAAAKDTPDVVVGADPRGRVPAKGEKEISPVPGYLLRQVAAAAVKYEEKRPELLLRIRSEGSHLFFPAAGRASWAVTRDGDRLFVSTGCADKMYAAEFHFEFEKAGAGEGEWKYVRTHAHHYFKGE